MYPRENPVVRGLFLFVRLVLQPLLDDVWNEAARHYDEPALAALVLNIALINTWNRLNVTTGQMAGEWLDQWAEVPQVA